jgi:hypothetical protein
MVLGRLGQFADPGQMTPFAGQARRAAAASGAVTVLMSHRFSTVRMAGVILVVEEGRVSNPARPTGSWRSGPLCSAVRAPSPRLPLNRLGAEPVW